MSREGRRVGMSKNRLEAFSDGVLAVVITIMVLELKVPHEPTLEGLVPLLPVFLSYVLSFAYVAIYWNNHHHMIYVVRGIDGAVLWANLHLLFWLSLTPFVTGWMGENHFEAVPIALYGCVLLMAAISYTILQFAIVRHDGKASTLATALGGDLKGKLSIVGYVVAIGSAFFFKPLSLALYVAVALMWFVPDRRIERVVHEHPVGE